MSCEFCRIVVYWVRCPTLSAPDRQWKGGGEMDVIVGFIVSVIAGIASHYICKFFDQRNNKGQ